MQAAELDRQVPGVLETIRRNNGTPEGARARDVLASSGLDHGLLLLILARARFLGLVHYDSVGDRYRLDEGTAPG